MLGRYRRAYSALGLCLIIGLALTVGAFAQNLDNSPNAKGGPQVTKPAPTKNLEPALTAIQKSIEGIASTIESVSANPYAEEERERSKADLKAQQDMANWAYKVYLATAITAALTGIGVVLIGFTLRYTAQTLTEAKATTKAAQATVDVTREVGEAQVRAYLSFESAVFRILDTVVVVWPTIKNTGQSPAQWIEMDGRIRLMGGVDESERESSSSSPIPAGQTGFGMFMFHIQRTEEREAYLGRGEPFMPRCSVQWDDVFGKRHTILARFAVEEDGSNLYGEGDKRYRTGKMSARNYSPINPEEDELQGPEDRD